MISICNCFIKNLVKLEKVVKKSCYMYCKGIRLMLKIFILDDNVKKNERMEKKLSVCFISK